jgi:hypothetical protein
MAFYLILGPNDKPVGCIQYPGGNQVPLEYCQKVKGGSSNFGGFGRRGVFRRSVLRAPRLMPTTFKSKKTSSCGCTNCGCSK